MKLYDGFEEVQVNSTCMQINIKYPKDKEAIEIIHANVDFNSFGCIITGFVKEGIDTYKHCWFDLKKTKARKLKPRKKK